MSSTKLEIICYHRNAFYSSQNSGQLIGLWTPAFSFKPPFFNSSPLKVKLLKPKKAMHWVLNSHTTG